MNDVVVKEIILKQNTICEIIMVNTGNFSCSMMVDLWNLFEDFIGANIISVFIIYFFFFFVIILSIFNCFLPCVYLSEFLSVCVFIGLDYA